MDIITIQNPFNFLTRDSDVESMSDGWDDGTAYGYNDVAGVLLPLVACHSSVYVSMPFIGLCVALPADVCGSSYSRLLRRRPMTTAVPQPTL